MSRTVPDRRLHGGRPCRTPHVLSRIRSPLLRGLAYATLATTAAATLVAAAAVAVMLVVWNNARVDNVDTLDFANPLHVPPVLEPTTEAGGTKVFQLELGAGTSEILPGRATPTWGANGAHLGPTLRAERGDDIRIEVDNALPEATTLHWHGMHLPAAADGGPHQVIEPSQRWSPQWRIDQPAATLWYHPHLHGRTAEHSYRGLAGLFLVDDDVDHGLPEDYGVDDIPLIVQDKRFADDGSFDHGEPSFSGLGILGDHLLVNGTHDPHLEVTTDRVRLRLLNAATGRVFNFGFDDDRSFELVATDGGLLAAPHTTTRLQLSPGERAEIVVEVRPDDATVLRSYPPDLGVDGFQGRFSGGSDTFDVLQLRPAKELDARPPPPANTSTSVGPDPDAATVTRSFDLQGSTRINGATMDMSRVDVVAEVDTTELWTVTNQSGSIHNFHVHDVQFRVRSYNGAPPPPELSGPKDTIFLPPGATAQLALHFSEHTDPTTPYMYHCHILSHEDDGMMGQFTVVERGTADAAPRQIVHPGHDHHGD